MVCDNAPDWQGEPVRLLINDLKRHNEALAAELRQAIDRVLARGWFILGPEVEAFEQEFAQVCGVGSCVGVANGTEALELALRALEVGPGDEVATVANAGYYSSAAIRAAGALPRYVDIEPGSMNMDPAALATALTPRTCAVIVTHLYGRMAAMPALLQVAGRAGVPVIEDCAQAHGAALEGRPAGSWGVAGCYSFYPTKNLGALGDGGAVVTSDAALAQRLRRLRQYGWREKYRCALAGGRNSRLDEIQAALLRAKLPHLPAWNERRRAVARAYSAALSGAPVAVPESFGEDYVAHLYVVRAPRRDELRAALAAKGVMAEVHYPVPDHRQEQSPGGPALPVTEQAVSGILTLPCFPELTGAEVELVSRAVLEFFAS
jgi:dTDP-4-amino-4,6-dideoxygalactose transaminase